MGPRLEKSVRAGLLRILTRPNARARTFAPQSPPRSVLLIRPDRLGDAIISTPLIKHLRRAWPDARLDILLGPKNQAIAPLLPCIDRCHVLSIHPLQTLSAIHALRSARYDLVLNLLLKPSASARAAALLSGGRSVVSLDTLWDGRASHTEHVVNATCRVLEVLGFAEVPNEPLEPDDSLGVVIADAALAHGMRTLDADQPSVLVNISASHADRRPGENWYSKLLRGLAGAGLRAFVVGLPSDEARARRLAETTSATCIPPEADYGAFAGYVAAADVVITPDGSVVHLSAATGRPTIVLASSAHTAQQWSPWGVPSQTFASQGSLDSIPVADVIIAAQSLMGTLDE